METHIQLESVMHTTVNINQYFFNLFIHTQYWLISASFYSIATIHIYIIYVIVVAVWQSGT